MAIDWAAYKVKYKSTQTIYQQQIYCQVNENEFNYTLNPSTIKDDNIMFYSSSIDGSTYLIKTGSTGTVKDFVTGSDFAPYVTTVGLYNDANELLGVAKLAQPFRMPANTDVTFVVRYDF